MQKIQNSHMYISSTSNKTVQNNVQANEVSQDILRKKDS